MGAAPGPDEFTRLLNGTRFFGDTCAFLKVTGQPCPQCGMTRSFVYAARGHFVTSFFYSPGGLGLFLWSQVAGIVGAARLVRGALRVRRGAAVRPGWPPLPWQLVVGWALGWTLLLYLVPYALRLYGINPLP
ncbi:MAG: DUF2752 domain-containing protein [Myxococcota bacterium]